MGNASRAKRGKTRQKRPGKQKFAAIPPATATQGRKIKTVRAQGGGAVRRQHRSPAIHSVPSPPPPRHSVPLGTTFAVGIRSLKIMTYNIRWLGYWKGGPGKRDMEFLNTLLRTKDVDICVVVEVMKDRPAALSNVNSLFPTALVGTSVRRSMNSEVWEPWEQGLSSLKSKVMVKVLNARDDPVLTSPKRQQACIDISSEALKELDEINKKLTNAITELALTHMGELPESDAKRRKTAEMERNEIEDSLSVDALWAWVFTTMTPVAAPLPGAALPGTDLLDEMVKLTPGAFTVHHLNKSDAETVSIITKATLGVRWGPVGKLSNGTNQGRVPYTITAQLPSYPVNINLVAWHAPFTNHAWRRTQLNYLLGSGNALNTYAAVSGLTILAGDWNLDGKNPALDTEELLLEKGCPVEQWPSVAWSDVGQGTTFAQEARSYDHLLVYRGPGMFKAGQVGGSKDDSDHKWLLRELTF